MHTVRGTFNYLSSELHYSYNQKIDQSNYNPYLSDLFSIGVTFLQMFLLVDNIDYSKIKNF